MADEEKCDPIKFYPPSDVFGGEKPVPSCLPAPERIPNELARPEETEKEPIALQVPGSLRVVNFEAVAVCPEGSIGPAVITAAGTLVKKYYLTDYASVPSDVLNYIAVNKLEVWIEQRITDKNFTAEELADRTGLSSNTAEAILKSIRTIQDELTETALNLAQDKLICYWLNTPQIAECEDPEMAHPEDHPDAVFRVIVPAGAVKSYVSQTDANNIAKRQAERGLNCFYISDPITVNCHTRPDRPYPETEPVPNDTKPVYPGLALRVGTFHVPIGQFISKLSKEDANTKAEIFAYSYLICFYVNDPVYLACEDPDARGYGKLPPAPAVEANIVTKTPGQSVMVPRGYITSIYSTAVATDEATRLAQSLLECCYVNRDIHVECPPYELFYEDGTPVVDVYGVPQTVPADQVKSPVFSYDVPAGKYISCESQKAADDMAIQEAEGMLNCYYCNRIVLPTCVPDWVITAVTTGILLEDGTVYKLPLPLDIKGLINPYTGEPEDITRWSENATMGMSADMFCSGEYVQSQQIADSAGLEAIPKVDARDDCFFVNDLVLAGCAVPDVYIQLGTEPGYTPSGEKYRFYSEFPVDAYKEDRLSLSNPAPGTYVEVPAGTIKMTALDVPGTLPPTDPNYNKEYNDQLVKDYVNEIAYQMALSWLYCRVTNPLALGYCEAETSPTRQDIIEGRDWDPWIIGPGLKPKPDFAPGSNTEANPIVVQLGTFTGKTLLEVYDKVVQFILNSLYCMYCNDPQQAECPPNLMTLSVGYVPACTFIMASKEEANAAARQLAQSMVVCADPIYAPIQGPPGPPGQDGAPGAPGQNTGGDCRGSCYGVYS